MKSTLKCYIWVYLGHLKCPSCCRYLVRAEFRQLPSCEVGGGLRGCGEAAVDKCVQREERGQQLILMHKKEIQDSFIYLGLIIHL